MTFKTKLLTQKVSMLGLSPNRISPHNQLKLQTKPIRTKGTFSSFAKISESSKTLNSISGQIPSISVAETELAWGEPKVLSLVLQLPPW